MMRKSNRGFTLVELLVSVAVLTLLVLLITRLLNSAAAITTLGHKQMDGGSQARQLLERMALDMAQMLKRSDVDFFSKGTAAPNSVGGLMTGNDQIAFYSAVLGYYPSIGSTGSQSPVSLVAYRVNAQNKLERIGKGLLWNGVSATSTPVVFLGLLGTSTGLISTNWPTATNLSAAPTPEPDAEVIGPQVFRFEYYYLLKNGTFSVIPWDTTAGHSDISGMQDVAAIVVDIAVIDPKSKVLLTNPQLTALAGQLKGVSTSATATDINVATMTPGALLTNWQSALDAITSSPRTAISAIRLYERYFYLSAPTL